MNGRPGLPVNLAWAWGPKALLVAAFLLTWQALFQAAAVFGVTHYASVFYPPAGLNVVALLLFGPRFAPVVALASLIAGAGYWYPDRPLTWLATTAAVGIGYGLGIGLYRRRMARAGNASALAAAGWCCLAATATALGTSLLHSLAYVATGAATTAEGIYFAGLFWVGDLVGILTVTPGALLLLAYTAPGFVAARLPWLSLGPLPAASRLLAYALALAGALGAAYGFPELVRADMRLWHLLLFPAIAIALHGGLPAALLAVSALNVGNVAAATLAGTDIPLPELQSLMLGTSLATLLLGAMASDRRRAMAHLEQTVAARTHALSEANRALEATSRAKSDFFSRMSHELRTPLNAIIGFADLIHRDRETFQDPALVREYAREIHEGGVHLQRLVDDLLDLSKAEAGKLEPCTEAVALPDVIRRAVRTVERQAAESGARIEVDVPKDFPLLHLDPRMMFQTLLNLLSNAVKFTPDDGTIRISARIDENGAVALRIRDTGIGMGPEDLAQALEPFGQVGRVPGRHHRGTGLGLPIARSFVEAHGGTLRLESHPGAGTTAMIHLPPFRIITAEDRTRTVNA